MKKRFLIALFLAPLAANAQVIYPLNVYASTTNAKTGQDIKFMESPENVTYVGTCKTNNGDKLCDLAKPGEYQTKDGVKVRVNRNSQLVSEDGSRHCHYTSGSTPSVSC